MGCSKIFNCCKAAESTSSDSAPFLHTPKGKYCFISTTTLLGFLSVAGAVLLTVGVFSLIAQGGVGFKPFQLVNRLTTSFAHKVAYSPSGIAIFAVSFGLGFLVSGLGGIAYLIARVARSSQ